MSHGYEFRETWGLSPTSQAAWSHQPAQGHRGQCSEGHEHWSGIADDIGWLSIS